MTRISVKPGTRRRADMKFEIVKMNESHIASVAALERECFASPWTEEQLRDELGKDYARFFVAVADDKVIGYIGAFNVVGEVSVTNLAVTEGCRKCGVASALINELESVSKAENAEFITLEVRASNEKAIKLYEKCGFTKSGLRKGFYRKPVEDAILMKKALK